MLHDHYYKVKVNTACRPEYEPQGKRGTCYLRSSCENCPHIGNCLLMANGLHEEEIEYKPLVVDDIRVKHTVLDSINARLGRIDQSLIGLHIGQGKTIREAELEKDLVAAYKKNKELIEIIDKLADELTEARDTITKLRKGQPFLYVNDEGLVETYQCGGSNSYTSIKVGVASHKEMTTTIRTNLQEISNGNAQIEQFGYMWGKWIKKNVDVYFLNGLYKALKEGNNGTN